jgi:ribokinase
VVGYLSLDQIVCASGRFEGVPGGAAYYCAAGAVAAGGTVRLIAVAGADFPEAALAELRGLGVDTRGVERLNAPSRRSKLHDPTGSDRRLPHMRDAGWWEAARHFAPPIPGGSGIFVYTAMPTEILDRQLAARGPDDILIADTSPAYASREPDAILAVVPRLFAFAPSREETRVLFPGHSDDAALVALAERCGLVLQKRGADGMALKRRDGAIQSVGSSAGSVIDTTGAGDSAMGALAAAVARNAGDAEILALCSATAARIIAGVGIAGLRSVL